MGAAFCPKCNTKMPTVDGKKIGGIIGNKYYVCLPCNFLKAVKHRKFNPEKRRKPK